MPGPKRSGQRAKPSKSASDRKDHGTSSAEKSAYAAVKSGGSGAVAGNKWKRIHARRQAKKSAKQNLRTLKAAGCYPGAS